MFDNKIKNDFPILNRKIHGNQKLVYLDSAATSQKPEAVISAMDNYYRSINANVHRGIHALAEEATLAFEEAREKIARFVGVENQNQLIFTRNTTESINLIAKTWGVEFLNEGDLVVSTEMEHHSNIVPWYMLRDKKKIDIKFIGITPDGKLDLDRFAALLKLEPKVITITHMSNVLGVINPIKSIIEAAHKAGAIVIVDGAQSVAHITVDIHDLDVDFYAFSAHKMCGPTGIGILYGKKELLERMPPLFGGGDMIRKVTLEGFTTNSLPYKFEAGTPSIAEAIGFGAAVDYLESLGMDKIHMHERELTKYAYEALYKVSGLTILGPPPEDRGGVLSFTIENIHPHDVAQILDQYGIAVRAGHHCAMPLHDKLSIPASTRASLYLYNTEEDIDKLIGGLHNTLDVFK